MPGARLNYLELRAADLAASRSFYADALGLTFIDYGPSYAAATQTGGAALGLEARRAVPNLQVDVVQDFLGELAPAQQPGEHREQAAAGLAVEHGQRVGVAPRDRGEPVGQLGGRLDLHTGIVSLGSRA